MALICKLEGCEKELPVVAIKNEDPFCSTECAKKFHGVHFAAPEAMNVKRPIVHGTVHAYANRKCRCDKCVAANNEYKKHRYAVSKIVKKSKYE